MTNKIFIKILSANAFVLTALLIYGVTVMHIANKVTFDRLYNRVTNNCIMNTGNAHWCDQLFLKKTYYGGYD